MITMWLLALCHAADLAAQPEERPAVAVAVEALDAAEPPPPMSVGRSARVAGRPSGRRFVTLAAVSDAGGGLRSAGPGVHDRCAEAGQVFTDHAWIEMSFPADEALAAEARRAADRCDIEFRTLLHAWYDVELGQRACVFGRWEILQADGTVLWARNLDQCKAGSLHGGAVHPLKLELPDNVDPTDLRVRFAGEAVFECGDSPSPGRAQVGVAFDRGARMTWRSCGPMN